MNKKTEVTYINVLKALGIIAMVLGHSGSPFVKYIYLYHMALFFFISGYFYKDAYEQKPFKLLFKRIKSLYLPFVCYEIIFVLIRNFLISINIYNENTTPSIHGINEFISYMKLIITFNYTGDNLVSTFWFLKTLFYVNILFLIINLLIKKVRVKSEYQRFIILTFIFIASFYGLRNGVNIMGYINPSNRKIISLFTNIIDYRNLILVNIYYMGYLYKKYEEKIPLNIYLVIISILFLKHNSNIGGIEISAYQFKNPIYFLLNSLMGIYVNIYFSKILAKRRMPLLEYIGKNSMCIMIFHFLSFKLVSLAIIFIYNLEINELASFPAIYIGKYWYIVYTIVGVCIPIMIKYCIDIVNRYIHKLKHISSVESA